MITGYGRGVTIGGDLASRLCLFTFEHLTPLGKEEYRRLRQEGYAHLGTLEEFLPGFIAGFRTAAASSRDSGLSVPLR